MIEVMASSTQFKDRLVIRLFNQKDDDVVTLTHLLNAAYKPLADMGLNYLASHQGPETTLKRITEAKCLIILSENQIIGTLSYYAPGVKTDSDWYRKPKVGVVGQFGILPEYQKHGLGTMLLNRAEIEAKTDGAEELALDTAEQAIHLHRFYANQGFRLVGTVNWQHTNYKSVVMSKSLI